MRDEICRPGERSQVVCVSEAVRQACIEAGYPPAQLAVVRNGLPPLVPAGGASGMGAFRLGFLGVFAARKGLPGLFEILDKLDTPVRWELSLAGDAQEKLSSAETALSCPAT